MEEKSIHMLERAIHRGEMEKEREKERQSGFFHPLFLS